MAAAMLLDPERQLSHARTVAEVVNLLPRTDALAEP